MDNHENANETYLAKSIKSLQSSCGVLAVSLVSIRILQMPVTVFSIQPNFWAVNSLTFHSSTLRPKHNWIFLATVRIFIGQEFMASALLHEKWREGSNHKPEWEESSLQPVNKKN